MLSKLSIIPDLWLRIFGIKDETKLYCDQWYVLSYKIKIKKLKVGTPILCDKNPVSITLFYALKELQEEGAIVRVSEGCSPDMTLWRVQPNAYNTRPPKVMEEMCEECAQG